jgi:hypothetical protein
MPGGATVTQRALGWRGGKPNTFTLVAFFHHRLIAIAWRRQSPMGAAFWLITDNVQNRARCLLTD